MYKIIAKIRNSKVSRLDFVEYLLSKGVFSFLRGLIASPFLSRRFPFFMGAGVRIFHANNAKLGACVYIGDYSVLNFLSLGGVLIEDNVTIREFCWMQLTSSLSNPGGSIYIGENTYIGPRANLGAAGDLVIGARCQIGASVSFIAENHNYSGGVEIYGQGVSRKGIVIGEDCWIGNGAIILDGVELGNGVVVGAGSVVTKSFPAGAVIVGNPARLLKCRV
ncbi:acyltransferase [Zhongshania arctica]|uniref:Acyltransferase n=1 Tax=Zhongshania arctica TaxID=3238302 RepID=A0ABV3TS26_9GAMM